MNTNLKYNNYSAQDERAIRAAPVETTGGGFVGFVGSVGSVTRG